MRLDIYLVNNKIVESRNKASELISNNKVTVNDKVISKNSYDVKESDIVKILDNKVLEFVSRGGHKLDKAILYFNLDFKDKVICDIGSSTGGFSDCSLKYGAKKVYAIDVGTNQLHESLRNREDVVVYENTNFKDVTLDYFKEPIDYFVCDVSFISIRQILLKLKSLAIDFDIVILFKPQFEVGKNKLNKKGVVKNKNYLIDALDDFVIFLKDNKLSMKNFTFSPIKGNKEGNIEFLAYINNRNENNTFDFNRIVKEAIKVLEGEENA